MFHPRPFGGIVNIFAKSPKGEQASKNDGPSSHITDHTGTPQDGSTLSHEGSMTYHKRSVNSEEGSHGSFKSFDNKRISDDFKSSQMVQAAAATKTEPYQQLPPIEIPKNAPQMATSQHIFDKLYLINLMFSHERLSQENKSMLGDMEALRFKFVGVLPHVHQHGGMRDLGHGSREGASGLYMHGGSSAFEHADTGRKSIEISPGHRRNYFDQRTQKNKDAFRHSREGFDASDYNKRTDQQDSHVHRGDDHGKKKTFEDNTHRGDYKFGYDKFKNHEGPSRQDDERKLHIKSLEQSKQTTSAFHSPAKMYSAQTETDLTMRSGIHRRQSDRFEARDSYRKIDSLQHRTDNMISLSAEASVLHRPSPELRLAEASVLNSALGLKDCVDDKLLQYASLTGTPGKGTQSWIRSSEAFSWHSSASTRFEANVKAAPVLSSPALKTGSASQSFLERLLDKSFDSTETGLETVVLDAATQFQKTLQFGTDVTQTQPTINLEWQYKDPHGLIHGPFSSSQMYTWYINNFFNPNLQMRYNHKMPWTPFKDLYPATSTPFRENPIGFNTKTPKQISVTKVLETNTDVTTPASAVKEAESKPINVAAQDNESPVFNPRWNKPDDLKVDSLLEIMEKQKRQSATRTLSAQRTPPANPKPSPGWNLSGAEPIPIPSDDFPTLALGVEKSAKPKKKTAGPFQHNTMPLKVFMKQHAQTPESTKIQPKESFASKVMGHKQ